MTDYELPQLMVKIWDGDDAEYFTWLDMNRIEYNLNLLADYLKLDRVTYATTARASQFDYREAQKVENHLQILADALSIVLPTPIETLWGELRTVSYVDFERWESNFWVLYQAMGGRGERIPAGKVFITYGVIAYADKWEGTGPYHQYQEAPGLFTDTDALAYISHTATPAQTAQAYNAMLRLDVPSDRMLVIRALSIKPTIDIPLKVAVGGLEMFKEISLTSDGWEGTGPWTQTVTLDTAVVNAVIGAWEGMTDDAVLALMMGKISVSAVSGTSVTVRCIGTKPTMTINPIIMWETSETG